MRSRTKLLGFLVVVLAACGGTTAVKDGAAGTGGAGGGGGEAGQAGSGGSAGSGGEAGNAGVGGSGGTGGAAGTGGDAGTGGGGSAPCFDAPQEGTCLQEGLECWYGDDPRPDCRTRSFCLDGEWKVQPSACPPLFPPGDECPEDPNNVPDGFCPGGDLPETVNCDYGDGLVCGCTVAFGPEPAAVWSCLHRAGHEDCPSVAPNVGQACSLPSEASCSYNYACHGFVLECRDGLWVVAGEMVC